MASMVRETRQGAVTVTVGDELDWGFAPSVPATVAHLRYGLAWVTVPDGVAALMGDAPGRLYWARWESLRVEGWGYLR